MPQGEDENREHFLEHTLPQWFCTAGELNLTKADGDWKEADHMDGGASVLHMGVTVYGDRDMVCHRPGFETDPVVVRNAGGTVYFGVLTGPRHGVTHRPSMPDQLLPHRLGQLSATIMMRTTLFPHCRSRLKGTTPSPSIWYGRLAENMSASLSSLQWHLPSRAACESVYAPPPASVPNQLKASPAKRIKDEPATKVPEFKAVPVSKHFQSKRAKH